MLIYFGHLWLVVEVNEPINFNKWYQRIHLCLWLLFIFFYYLNKQKKTFLYGFSDGLKCPFFLLVFWLNFDNFLSLRTIHGIFLRFFGNFWKSFTYKLDRFSGVEMAVHVWFSQICFTVFWIKMRPWIHIKLDLEQNKPKNTENGGWNLLLPAGRVVMIRIWRAQETGDGGGLVRQVVCCFSQTMPSFLPATCRFVH